MTTEDDFHRMLDQNPDDHHTRLVFADWLEEHNDPRAAGYRALGTLRKRARSWKSREDSPDDGPRSMWTSGVGFGATYEDTLPVDWYKLMQEQETPQPRTRADSAWTDHLRRRDGDTAAALAFSKLPPKRQHELLNGPQQMQRQESRAKSRMRYSRGVL